MADELDQREAAREARRNAERGRLFEENSIRAAIVEAEQRGDWVSARTIADVAVIPLLDLLDLSVRSRTDDPGLTTISTAWQERREFEEWKQNRQQGANADTSAPSEAEVTEQARAAEQAATRNAQRHERVVTVRQARAMAK